MGFFLIVEPFPPENVGFLKRLLTILFHWRETAYLPVYSFNTHITEDEDDDEEDGNNDDSKAE